MVVAVAGKVSIKRINGIKGAKSKSIKIKKAKVKVEKLKKSKLNIKELEKKRLRIKDSKVSGTKVNENTIILKKGSKNKKIEVGEKGKTTGEVGIEGGTQVDNTYELYRKEANTGTFKNLQEPMQLKNVKNVANEAGVGLKGIKVKIDRNSELLGRNVYGYTDGKTITLYPDAFTNTETLVKTLGHERMHVYQVGVFGKPTSTDVLGAFERGASMSEQSWWNYFNFKNGGQ